MRICPRVALVCAVLACATVAHAEGRVVFSGEKRLNNLVSELLEVAEVSGRSNSFAFERSRAGWIFVSAACRGNGTVALHLDDGPNTIAVRELTAGQPQFEAVRHISAGKHNLRVRCAGGVVVEKLAVRAIPELLHCGLGFNSAIKAYGKYDWKFLEKDILPNVTTLVVPHNIQLSPETIDGWHQQGKKFIAAVGINHQAKTAEEHYKHWTGYWERAPFLDGIIIDEFIINNPYREWVTNLTPERLKRFEEESARHPVYEEAFRMIRADERFQEKLLYAYIGGSGKKLNQEIVGPTFIRSLLDCGYRIALERYIFEVSSEQKSKDVLQLFVEGLADWVAKEPTVREQMVLTFGLFSMPPGGINKQPNVDYHVWMDQQMHVVANHPVMAGMAGLNWWTSLQADEETVRFVGRLYRHYAIEGKTELLTRDPLFLPHIHNADFEKGLEGWTLKAAEDGSLQAKSFPRYGRIEGRYMGLGSPADPEHIGDTFLWTKRSAHGPNTVSQTVKQLEPGRLYSLKMFSCDYQDLVNPQKKTRDEAQPFYGRITIDGAHVDAKRSFREVYASSPEPPIPVWITYHWIVFRAEGPTATLTISDWPDEQDPAGQFGQEQTFNFLELQPYHE